MFDKMNTDSIILIYKHKLINRSLSLLFNFLLQGQVVVLVQSVEGQSSYDVLAVGKVSGVATLDLVPVLVHLQLIFSLLVRWSYGQRPWLQCMENKLKKNQSQQKSYPPSPAFLLVPQKIVE